MGRLTYNVNSIVFTPDNNLYGGHEYTMPRKGTSVGNGGNGGNSNEITIYDQPINGDKHEQKTVEVNLPTGLKSVTFMTKDQDGNYRNWADMYVRKGSYPKLTYEIIPGGNVVNFSSVADCAGEKPNNESEICVFQNPAAGKWYVTLFGYNNYFQSRLIVSGSK